MYNGGGNYSLALGYNAFNVWTLDRTIAITSVDTATKNFTVTGHGVPSGSIAVCKISGTTAPGGVALNTIYTFKYVDADTLKFIGWQIITDAGSNISLEISKRYDNSAAIGYNAQPTKSNQIVLGDANVNEIVVGGHAYAADQLGGVTRVQNHVTAAKVYASATDTHLDLLDTAITCEAGDQVLIHATISLETHHDKVFYVKRNGVEIGSPGNRQYEGMIPMPYDTNLDSTQSNIHFSFIDESPVEGLNTYSFHMRGTDYGVWLNRTIGADYAASKERTASNIILEK